MSGCGCKKCIETKLNTNEHIISEEIRNFISENLRESPDDTSQSLNLQPNLTLRSKHNTFPSKSANIGRTILLPMGDIPLEDKLPPSYWWYVAASKARDSMHSRLIPNIKAQKPSLSELLAGGPTMEFRKQAFSLLYDKKTVFKNSSDKIDVTNGSHNRMNSLPQNPSQVDMNPLYKSFESLDYGNLHLSFDRKWLSDYIHYDRALSVEDTLTLLWAPLQNGGGPSNATLLQMIHCWNIGAYPQNGVTWNAFWPDGGPINFFTTALKMIATWPQYAVDDFSGSKECVGLSEFICRAFKGKDVVPIDGTPCDVRFFVRSVDPEFTEVSEPCLGNVLESCGQGIFDSIRGIRAGDVYDAWEPIFFLNTPSSVGYQWKGCLNGVVGDPINDNYTGAAQSQFMGIQFPAAPMAFQGFVADWLMWWARTSLQYAFEQGSISHLEGAIRLARLVLTRAAFIANTIIHEMGHVYLGASGHCNGHRHGAPVYLGCCMQVAANNWSCAVTSLLSLQKDYATLKDEPPYYGHKTNISCEGAGGTDLCILSDPYLYLANIGDCHDT